MRAIENAAIGIGKPAEQEIEPHVEVGHVGNRGQQPPPRRQAVADQAEHRRRPRHVLQGVGRENHSEPARQPGEVLEVEDGDGLERLPQTGQAAQRGFQADPAQVGTVHQPGHVPQARAELQHAAARGELLHPGRQDAVAGTAEVLEDVPLGWRNGGCGHSLGVAEPPVSCGVFGAVTILWPQ